jgi:hypothetical protein
MIATSNTIIESRREEVFHSYKSAIATNKRMFLEGNPKATSEYIYPNQQEDAMNIVNLFHDSECRVISIQKKTKVGADGLMIEIAKLMTTHPDDNFVVNSHNVRILTGMSNVSWECDMKEKTPTCFKNSIYHNGQLSKSNLSSDLTNSLIIVDEVDAGTKEEQRIHVLLKDAGLLDVRHMVQNNNRFVFISASMVRELYDLYRWGDLHKLFKMTIPDSYIGHTEFVQKGFIKEFYPLNVSSNADKWIKEDIVEHYRTPDVILNSIETYQPDFRVPNIRVNNNIPVQTYKHDFRLHIARVTLKTVGVLQNACIKANIDFRNHTSTDRISEADIIQIFNAPLTNHIVIAIKGFFRRANLIPNPWKLKIGATHELYTKNPDDSVQAQGLPGRLSGYWKDDIENGHKTGPHRTSLKSMQNYEAVYQKPFGNNSYRTAGFIKKVNTDVSSTITTMLNEKHIPNLTAEDELRLSNDYERKWDVYNTQDENEAAAVQYGSTRRSNYKVNVNGFKMCSTTHLKVQSLKEIEELAHSKNPCSNLDKAMGGFEVGEYAYRKYVCYVDINDKATERFAVIYTKRLK